MWADTMGGEYYCGDLLWQSCWTYYPTHTNHWATTLSMSRSRRTAYGFRSRNDGALSHRISALVIMTLAILAASIDRAIGKIKKDHIFKKHVSIVEVYRDFCDEALTANICMAVQFRASSDQRQINKSRLSKAIIDLYASMSWMVRTCYDVRGHLF